MRINDPVRVVGYGISVPETEDGLNTKRTALIPLASLAPGHIVHGTDTVNTCQETPAGRTCSTPERTARSA